MSKRRYLLGDVETTGFSGTPGVVEIAWFEVDEDLNIIDKQYSLIDPQRPIDPGASGVHHITNSMVAEAPTMSEFFEYIYGGKIEGDIVLVAHNSKYDREFFGPWCNKLNHEICTLKLARRYLPEQDNHKLQTLRYSLGLDAGTAHSAEGDVTALYNLLRHLLDLSGETLESLITRSSEPLFVHQMPFGKHKGTPIQEVPKDYLQWLSRQDNVDPDLRYTLDKVLTK